MNLIKPLLYKWFHTTLPLTVFLVSLSSCHAVYEDARECPQGVALRFVYDYNMEFANAFPSKVHCLTLHVYDGEGNWIAKKTETTDLLADENYRMEFDLGPGSYHCIAYGGIECDEKTFSHVNEPSEINYHDILVKLDRDFAESENLHERKLHDFFWGSADFTIEPDTYFYQEHKVEMMKNTNSIRVMLQHVDGSPVDVEDFLFEITDDNTAFIHDNSIVADNGIVYRPWSKGNETVGADNEGENGVTVAYSELSVSRLMKTNSPTLRIYKNREALTRHDDADDVVASLPLQDYLPLAKSDYYESMSDQEYLDRQSDYSLLFFLDKNDKWINVQIKVGDWTVRVNNAEYKRGSTD